MAARAVFPQTNCSNYHAPVLLLRIEDHTSRTLLPTASAKASCRGSPPNSVQRSLPCAGYSLMPSHLPSTSRLGFNDHVAMVWITR